MPFKGEKWIKKKIKLEEIDREKWRERIKMEKWFKKVIKQLKKRKFKEKI